MQRDRRVEPINLFHSYNQISIKNKRSPMVKRNFTCARKISEVVYSQTEFYSNASEEKDYFCANIRSLSSQYYIKDSSYT